MLMEMLQTFVAFIFITHKDCCLFNDGGVYIFIKILVIRLFPKE
jgi:hypothetical protein